MMSDPSLANNITLRFAAMSPCLPDLMKVSIEGHGFETVGGFLVSRLGRVPAVGEHLEIDGLDVEIVENEQRRITRVRMSRLEPVPANDTAQTE